MAFERKLYCCLSQGVGLFYIGFGRDMACRALQVVGDGPVIFMSELVFHESGDDGCHAAELCVSESIACPGGDELAIGVP